MPDPKKYVPLEYNEKCTRCNISDSTTEYDQLLIDLLKQGKFTAEVGK